MELLLFLLQVFVISLSGALAPGPVTAAAIAMGARNRFAGTLMAIGHGIIEFPLMVLIILGADTLLKSTPTRIAIGLAGGTVLVVMAIQMLRSLSDKTNREATYTKTGPLAAGILLSGGNPYFLLWWATVGLTLATRARSLGVWAFGLFAVTHWLCDLIWLSALSWASFRGTVLLGPWVLRVVLLICSLALLAFGAYFIYDAGGMLIELILAYRH
ncbi:MAG: LysE family transporter [Phycisphaerales bacterium]|nr:MAG: LysE family transporter [Phycisphaerales bacterium]